jgi:4-hydroxy-2-oxoheptanedioate aldolase
MTISTINRLRKRWEAGEATYGVGLTIPSPAVAQLLAAAGFDWLMIDMEHGPIPIDQAHAMIAATAGAPVDTWVRVPHNVPWLAKPVLDAGAAGIVFPMVNSADEAVSAARATRYPPAGDRMWGPFYAPARNGMSMPDYLRAANDEIATIVLVEHPDAIERIEEIVAVDGIDAAVIGTHDLAVSMGYPGQPNHPAVLDAVARAESAILESPVVLGGNAFGSEQAKRMVDRGYRLLALGFDWSLLQRGVDQVLADIRSSGRAGTAELDLAASG